MNTLFRALVIALYLPLNAEIVVCTHIHDARDKILQAIKDHENVIIFSDLDDTLLRPTKFYGSTPWFNKQYKEVGHDKAISGLGEAYKIIDVMQVESMTQSFIEEVKRNAQVHGLTARSAHLNDITHKHLESLDISFDHYPNAPQLQGPCEIRHDKGVFFVGNSSKGDIIKQLINHMETKPTRIIFMDDSEKHVKTVDNLMNELGIACTAIHYTHVEHTDPYGLK